MTEQVYDGIAVLGRQFRHVESIEGVTPERLEVLRLIGKKGPISVRLLANGFGVRSSTMSRMLSAMEEVRLLRRVADKEDGRGVLISLTPKGRRVFARASKKSHQMLEDALRKLSDEEVNTLIDLANALSSFYRR